MIQFIKDKIIHRFGISQSITIDQGTMLIGEEMNYFAVDCGIQLIRSTPFYAQANGQAEAFDKVLIGILEKMIEENLRDWNRILSKTLWAYKTSKRSSTGVSHFSLTYGQDAVLPIEVVVPSLRVSRKNGLTLQEYSETMMMELKSADDRRIQAFNYMLIQKNNVAQTYNKRIKRKSFEVRELVWKIILLVGSKEKELGKWSPNWEGPFKVYQVLPRNAYWLANLQGEPHKRFINGRYLKKYFPTMWEIVKNSQKN